MMGKTWRKRITTWSMMGLLVVGLTVWFALPARAVPIEYTLEGGAAVGEITFDNTLASPYTAWTISIQGQSFSNVTDVINNNICNSGICTLSTSDTINPISSKSLQFTNQFDIGLNNHYSMTVIVCRELCFTFGDGGILVKQGQNVPEATSGVFFLIGLLVLAGARWWTHRQARLQLG
jgi:hypothetical protein